MAEWGDATVAGSPILLIVILFCDHIFRLVSHYFHLLLAFPMWSIWWLLFKIIRFAYDLVKWCCIGYWCRIEVGFDISKCLGSLSSLGLLRILIFPLVPNRVRVFNLPLWLLKIILTCTQSWHFRQWIRLVVNCISWGHSSFDFHCLLSFIFIPHFSILALRFGAIRIYWDLLW